MQGFILALIVKALQNKEVRGFLLEFAAKLGAFLLPNLAALLPAAAAGAVKVFLEKLPGVPDLGDVDQVIDQVHTAVNDMIPDVDIPVLSDAVQQFTGFDLTDWLKRI